jgi:hypothetical protein
MRTPAGFECRYFYGNYFRGRNTEECRLIGNAPAPNHWTRDLCKKCPVPGILRANACPNIVLEGKVTSGFLGRFRQVKVSAFCTRANKPVSEPEIGCGLCHPLPSIFQEEKE